MKLSSDHSSIRTAATTHQAVMARVEGARDGLNKAMTDINILTEKLLPGSSLPAQLKERLSTNLSHIYQGLNQTHEEIHSLLEEVQIHLGKF